MQEFNSLLSDESMFFPNWILFCLYLLSICFFFQIQDHFLSSLGQWLSGFSPELSIASSVFIAQKNHCLPGNVPELLLQKCEWVLMLLQAGIYT